MGKDNGQKKNKKRSDDNQRTIEKVETPEQKTLNPPQQEGQENGILNKKRKRQEVFPFGNYRNYYGYRISHDSDEDPRLKVMRKEWFEGKDCLDIGCNSGIITIHIAKKFQCRSILGVDIDSSRIEDAYWHLRKFVRTQHSAKRGEKKPSPEVLNRVKSSEEPSLTLSSAETKVENPRHQNLLDIVSFQKENIVQSRNLDENRYDTILCLSVTKWVHLNWGDDGLITLFSKIWRLLNPGGTLILEPQPWKSYENNRRVTETIAMNYRKITIRPELFQEILLDKIGFRTVEDLTSSLSGANKGFDRQILAFQK
ncbi:PREDICTED: probable RNA methyltransferase At5g51130 [Tarenaya hassleriana]|uniref:probable RNA methyltransferase At5g51130 n=1 Tax=Tarenaya hassleriana TaxID=28532 RepID=UPI00053C5423|nr:PREDICTED: probable RNA methyltransferase At5g51130 [Tarenaya hassleriana]